MSIENAITDHAAALRELAAAIRATVGSGAITKLAACVEEVKPAAALVKADPELDAAVAKVEADAKAEQKKVMEMVEADRKPTTAKEAINVALAAAKAAKAEKAAPAEPVTLDWENDVRPVLVSVGKQRDVLVALMAKYDVPKGGKAPAEKWADLLAEANAIIAARG